MALRDLVIGPINLIIKQVRDVCDAVDGMIGGFVSGPASSVDDRIAVFDGTTGNLIKDGGSTIAEIVAGSGGLVTSVFGRTGNIVAATNDYNFAQIDKTTSSLANLTTRSAGDLSSGTLPDGRFPSALPAISGVNLTNLNAGNLASGTVPDARFPATLPALSGVNLTALNASNLASGTVPDARLSTNVTLGGNAFTGTGSIVRQASPTLTTPVLGVASATSLLIGNSQALRWNDANDAGLINVDAGPQITGDAVKVLDGSALGWLWARQIEVGDDPNFGPGVAPDGGGFYHDNIRSIATMTGNPDNFDKFKNITAYTRIENLNAHQTGTRDAYALEAESGVTDASNTFDLFTIYGIHANAFLKGSGDILDGLIGIMGKSHAFGSGVIAKHRGVQGWATSQVGATGTSVLAQGVYGLISNDASGHAMTVAVAGDFLLNSNAGTIGTGYVVRIRAETTGSGTISGNRYGLYIADQGVGAVSGTTYNFYSAGASRLNHIEGDLTWGGAAWASWTPTWTGLTLGNGTVVAKFKQLGKTIVCRVDLIFGSTTSVTGLIQFSLPVTAATYAGSLPTALGVARCADSSAGVSFEGVISLSGGLSSLVTYSVSGSQLSTVASSATVPFSWATGDELACQIIYEAA